MFTVQVKVVYYLPICAWFCRSLYTDYSGRAKTIQGGSKWTTLRKLSLTTQKAVSERG